MRTISSTAAIYALTSIGSLMSAAPVDAAPTLPASTYTIVDYDERVEYIRSDADWQRILGPAGRRQFIASRALMVSGGLLSFVGATAILATFGSLGVSSAYGATTVSGAAGSYQAYIYGFSGVLAVGGTMLLTGLVLTLPLPSRHRPMLVPRLQLVSGGPQ